MNLISSGQEPPNETADYADPERFEKEIRAFETLDAKAFPPAGAIVFLGSSTFRGWRTIAKDLAPLTTILRGFGGSNMNDALHYADRIAIAYKPRAVVLYEGDNDIAAGISPEKILDTFQALVEKVHKALPEARIYVLSIKPSTRRWAMWPQMQATNRLLGAACAKDQRLTYIDVASGMLDEKQEPREELLQEDGLHMTPAGYAIWRKALLPVLLKAELRFEDRRNPSIEK